MFSWVRKSSQELTGLSGAHHSVSCPFFPWTGGPPLPDCAHSHRHTGCHLQGNPERVLCPYLQAGGQHQRGGLDDVSPRQKPQGKGLFVSFVCALVGLAVDGREENNDFTGLQDLICEGPFY